MTTATSHTAGERKQRLIRDVADILGDESSESLQITSERVADFADHYVSHVHAEDLLDLSATDFAQLLEAHARLAMRRTVGEDALSVRDFDVAEDSWHSGCSLLQIVTDDRPFLVDSVTMEVTRQGWTIRDLFHPQYQVLRDANGALTDIVHRGTEGAVGESWMTLLLYPPLGVKAVDAEVTLSAGISEVLDEVRAATEDWAAMRAELTTTISMLERANDPDRADEVSEAKKLLSWLLQDNFTLLGHRVYDFAGGRYQPVPGTGLGVLRGDWEATDAFQALPTSDEPSVLVFTKDSVRSRVHRRSLRDYIGVRIIDANGTVTGERRLVGVMASPAYTDPVSRIPVLAAKANQILEMSGYDPRSHGAKALMSALNTYPRDELFHAAAEDLYPIIQRVSGISERRQVRLFLHPDPWGRFVSCLVYLPRERYTTEIRERLQQVLLDDLGGTGIDFQALVSESVLARLYFVVSLTPGAGSAIDHTQLERNLTEATRSWDDRFVDLVHGWPSEARGIDFPDSYKEIFGPVQGVSDLEVLNTLHDTRSVVVQLADAPAADTADLRLRLFRQSRTALPEVLPHLDRLGVEVIDEYPHEIDLRGRAVWLYEFGLRTPAGVTWTDADRQRFVRAFEASQAGHMELGPMNALVTTAGLEWFEVTWLRSMERYLRQAGVPYSIDYIGNALLANAPIATQLVAAFRAAHDPDLPGDPTAKRAAAEVILQQVEASLDHVESLDHDRIIRTFVSVQRAIVRTNAFSEGDALAFKLLPRTLELLPAPRPMFEIWVHDPQVEGVHLRFGRVARGGLRWSDRAEDFRTEVLGLVKAQMVKNTVIVPVGAKGGFVARQLPEDRSGRQAEGEQAYRRFVSALLSITDNIVAGEVVPPTKVVRHDDDDPYLVVAADKGTATFSDLANAISLDRGFWLGDAFASGGTKGYDHKAMGITARGAWESVKRHFYEMGLDPQTDDFTCVGIGDMSGDVFGNGMLLSEHIKLVAAFDHRHIFIDPTPDPARSFTERQRMFDVPRSSWADYDASLLSVGGGIYPRTAKSIPITPQARSALDLQTAATSLSPTDYIHAILQAPVDLLWNGGIGTYVKASSETHADAGDRANDGLRVDGQQVRARCAGEGGNLGWTQLGRIEYARIGGRINTDFIDNSAGVDTSDHEVNIKILLDDAVASGRLDSHKRDEMLPQMTDEIAGLVLAHNVDQNVALAAARYQASRFAAIHEDWMRVLEEAGYLDRALEYVPGTAEMNRRIGAGEGLSSPELATLLAWTKICLADIIEDSDLPDDPYLADRLIQYFPKQLRTRFGDAMRQHRLHREIITTVAVNRFVNSQGMTAYHRLSTDTGAAAPDVIRAQLAARAMLRVGPLEVQLARQSLAAESQTVLRMDLRHMVDRVTRWVLQTQDRPIAVQAVIDQYGGPVRKVMRWLPDPLTPQAQQVYADRLAEITNLGVAPELAAAIAGSVFAPSAATIARIAENTNHKLNRTAQIFFAVRERLGIWRLFDLADELPRTDRWSLMSQAALIDELLDVQSQLAQAVVSAAKPKVTAADAVESFVTSRPELVRVLPLLDELESGPADLGRLSVAVRMLRSLLKG